MKKLKDIMKKKEFILSVISLTIFVLLYLVYDRKGYEYNKYFPPMNRIK